MQFLHPCCTSNCFFSFSDFDLCMAGVCTGQNVFATSTWVQKFLCERSMGWECVCTLMREGDTIFLAVFCHSYLRGKLGWKRIDIVADEGMQCCVDHKCCVLCCHEEVMWQSGTALIVRMELSS